MNIDGMIEWWIYLGKISINEPLMDMKKKNEEWRPKKLKLSK